MSESASEEAQKDGGEDGGTSAGPPKPVGVAGPWVPEGLIETHGADEEHTAREQAGDDGTAARLESENAVELGRIAARLEEIEATGERLEALESAGPDARLNTRITEIEEGQLSELSERLARLEKSLAEGVGASKEELAQVTGDVESRFADLEKRIEVATEAAEGRLLEATETSAAADERHAAELEKLAQQIGGEQAELRKGDREELEQRLAGVASRAAAQVKQASEDRREDLERLESDLVGTIEALAGKIGSLASASATTTEAHATLLETLESNDAKLHSELSARLDQLDTDTAAALERVRIAEASLTEADATGAQLQVGVEQLIGRIEGLEARLTKAAEETAAGLERGEQIARQPSDEARRSGAEIARLNGRVDELERHLAESALLTPPPVDPASQLALATPAPAREPVPAPEPPLTPPVAAGAGADVPEPPVGPEPLPPEPPPEPTVGPSESFPINEVTFDQLSAMGCSVTQAARVIGYRNGVGGFAGVEDIDSVPGLPAALRETLKDRLTAD